MALASSELCELASFESPEREYTIWMDIDTESPRKRIHNLEVNV